MTWIYVVVGGVWLIIEAGIIYLTVVVQKETGQVAIIRGGSWLGTAVAAACQQWWWFTLCLVILILSLLSGPRAERASSGGDTVNGSAK
jgi:hypothetical protein